MGSFEVVFSLNISIGSTKGRDYYLVVIFLKPPICFHIRVTINLTDCKNETAVALERPFFLA
jgi:hypothetical protein